MKIVSTPYNGATWELFDGFTGEWLMPPLEALEPGIYPVKITEAPDNVYFAEYDGNTFDKPGVILYFDYLGPISGRSIVLRLQPEAPPERIHEPSFVSATAETTNEGFSFESLLIWSLIIDAMAFMIYASNTNHASELTEAVRWLLSILFIQALIWAGMAISKD